MALADSLRNTVLAASLALTACSTSSSMAAPADGGRKLTFNGRAASARDLQILARFEAQWGLQIPDGAYWYDDASGAGGLWGGPTRGFLGAGLGLGGALPANASGGGDGNVTGVFINGRELHPLDVQGLTQIFGQAPWRGQWFVDGTGNFGQAGGPVLGNLVVLMQQREAASGKSYYRKDSLTGKSTFVGQGCVAHHRRKEEWNSTSDTYSYYVGCD